MSEATNTHDTERLAPVVASLCMAAASYGVAFGALGTALGLPVAAVAGISLVVYAGGSQMALLGVLAAGGAPLAGSLAGLVINSRLVAFGAAAAPLLGGRPWRRLAAAYLLTDESATVALAQPTEQGRRRAFWALGTWQWAAWQAATVAGAMIGTAVADPTTLGLDSAFPAAFALLLLPMLRARPEVAAAAGGVVGALVGAAVLPPGLPVLLAMGAGVAAGTAAARAPHQVPREHPAGPPTLAPPHPSPACPAIPLADAA